MEKNIEFTESGLQCDSCDWKDATITFANYKEWLNRPCPKCGANVLTEQDYKNAEAVRLSIDLVNSMSKEELEELSKQFSVDELKNHPMLAGAEGLKELGGDNEKQVSFTISTHKEIKVNEIKKVDEPKQ